MLAPTGRTAKDRTITPVVPRVQHETSLACRLNFCGIETLTGHWQRESHGWKGPVTLLSVSVFSLPLNAQKVGPLLKVEVGAPAEPALQRLSHLTG